jgi:hypothetical protein
MMHRDQEPFTNARKCPESLVGRQGLELWILGLEACCATDRESRLPHIPSNGSAAPARGGRGATSSQASPSSHEPTQERCGVVGLVVGLCPDWPRTDSPRDALSARSP